ncbi:hypothetical protein FNAPI_11964 [Fusarium napiforme]|uniref:Uncharacterized protein n=1 Tax=Fusarium napiforme TaxID=42672 RepID=A0A8H5IEH2_9HYPO|nr:hypothetical protein FNAPI_11964 [Fusarium napiforme]
MKFKSVMAASAMMELALAQASAGPLCSTVINLQPIEYQFQQPILIDSYFPANTDIVLDDGHVVHVTDAPTSLSTVLTDVSTSLTTLTSVTDGNGSPPDAGYLTFTIPANPDDIGNHPVTKTYPPSEPGQPGVVIIQVPTSPPGANGIPISSAPYVTVTTTGDFPSLTTTTITPDRPGATGSVIVEVPNTKSASPSASYVTVTTTGNLSPTDDPLTSTVPPSNPTDPGTVIIIVPSSPASSIPFITVTTTISTLNLTDNPTTSTVSPSGSTGTGTVIVEVPPSGSPVSSIPFITTTMTGTALSPTDDPVTSTISPSGSTGTGTVIVIVPSSSVSSVPFVTITTTDSTLNPTDNPITSTISPSGSTGTGTVIVEVPPSSSPASVPFTTITTTETSLNPTESPITTTISPSGSTGTGTVIVEVPPSSSPAGPASSPTPVTNSPSSSSPGGGSSGGPGSSGPSNSATQGPSDSAAPSSSTDGSGPSSSVPETSIPSPATTDDTPASTSASVPASSSAASNTQSEAPSSAGADTSSPATSPASSSSPSTSDADTSSPANPTTSSPASSTATSAPGSSTESFPSSSTSAAAANFDPCPDSLYGNPECCSLDVLGVADVECDSPTESPSDAADFQAICAASGKRARCCVLPVIALQQWGAKLRASLSCQVDTPGGTTTVNLTTTYDVNGIDNDVSTAFPGRNETAKPSLWWGESLLAWHSIALTNDMHVANERMTQTSLQFTRGTFPSRKEINCFFVPFSNNGVSPNVYYCSREKMNNTHMIEQLSKADDSDQLMPLPGIWISADNLAKAFYLTILADLGQTDSGPNILDNAELLAHSTKEYEAIRDRTPIWGDNLRVNTTEGLAHHAFTSQDLSRKNLGIEPSVISTTFLCQIPRLKSRPTLIVSVIINTILILSALWRLYQFLINAILYRNDPEIMNCAGCAAPSKEENEAMYLSGQSSQISASPSGDKARYTSIRQSDN